MMDQAILYIHQASTALLSSDSTFSSSNITSDISYSAHLCVSMTYNGHMKFASHMPVCGHTDKT